MIWKSIVNTDGSHSQIRNAVSEKSKCLNQVSHSCAVLFC